MPVECICHIHWLSLQMAMNILGSVYTNLQCKSGSISIYFRKCVYLSSCKQRCLLLTKFVNPSISLSNL